MSLCQDFFDFLFKFPQHFLVHWNASANHALRIYFMHTHHLDFGVLMDCIHKELPKLGIQYRSKDVHRLRQAITKKTAVKIKRSSMFMLAPKQNLFRLSLQDPFL